MITKTKIKPLKVPHVARHEEVACDLRHLEGFFILDVANELWIARENLSAQGQRTDLTSEEKFRSWSQYCEDIGSLGKEVKP